jgi:hypothetical protein
MEYFDMPTFPENDSDEGANWLAEFTKKLRIQYSENYLRPFVFCCGGKEIGNFNAMIPYIYNRLREYTKRCGMPVDNIYNSVYKFMNKKIK